MTSHLAVATLCGVDFPELLIGSMRRLGLRDYEQLAEHIGITPSALSKWIRARQSPPRTRWERLASRLEVTVAELGAAITATEMDTSPTVRARLRQCEDELEKLRQENHRLRSRLQGSR